MPYHTLIANKFTPDQALGMWELRISIAPYKQGQSYKDINRIITPIVRKYDLHLKIWEITSTHDLLSNYDGTTSRLGKDRTQRGKDVCIQFPNSVYCNFTDTDYKNMILSLWKALEEYDIPLDYMYISGDAKILGPGDFPTPFSITSSHPCHLPREWDNPHGILFKQFIPYETDHPLLRIRITKQDLSQHGISFNAAENFEQSKHYFFQHQKMALARLQTDIKNYSDQQMNFETVLFNDELIALLKLRWTEYNDSIASIDMCDRPAFREQFVSFINAHKTFSILIYGYPHQQGPEFLEHPAITKLKNCASLNSDTEIDFLIATLRKQYLDNKEKQLAEIKAYFALHSLGDEATLGIEWNEYIPDFSMDHLDFLIRQNPAGMQVLYRRIIILELERRAHQALIEQYIHYTPEWINHFSTDKKTIAVLDWNALVMEQDPPRGVTTLNENLISSLTSSGINEVFLCSEMIFNRQSVLERMALIDALKAKGLRVLAVATPADCVWNTPDKQLLSVGGQFYDSEDNPIAFATLFEQLNQGAIHLEAAEFSVGEIGHAFTEASTLYAEDFEAYKTFQKDNQFKSDLIFGISEYISRTTDYTLNQETENLYYKSKLCKLIIELHSKQKTNDGYFKALMFNTLIRHNNHCKSIVYFDTNKRRIAGVNECKNKLAGIRLITAIQVCRSNTDSLEEYLEAIREHQNQLPFIAPMAKLDITCNSFLDKFLSLENDENEGDFLQSDFELALTALSDDLAKDLNEKIAAGLTYETILASPTVKIIESTITMLNELDAVLSNPSTTPELKKRNIESIMKKYKGCTQISGCEKFFKSLVVVFAAAIGFALGALAGAGIGIAAGSWTGVGAALTGAMGLFSGAMQGASLGLLAGASATGLVVGGITQYGLFKKSAFITQMIHDVDLITDNMDELTSNTFLVN